MTATIQKNANTLSSVTSLSALIGLTSAGKLQQIPANFDVIAPVATGTAATDTANLQAAINATPSGGRLFIPRGLYKINAALSLTANITIEGDSVTPVFGAVSLGNSPITPTGLSGTVIEQQTVGADIIDIFTTSITPHLRRLGLSFASGLASTGHGVNASPSLVVAAGHDMGPQAFVWESVYVYGHDGNHYAFVLLNVQYGTLIQCHSYGGGGFNVIADAGNINSGNCVFISPYVAITAVGTAGGYVHSSGVGTPGRLNLLTYIRPQVICNGAVATAATNPMWNDLAGAGVPNGITVLGADFETGGLNTFTPGGLTNFIATAIINGQNSTTTRYGVGALPNWSGASYGSSNTAFGNNTLAVNSSGATNTAVGAGTLAANTTGSDNTAEGSGALATNTIGGSNTAVGARALNANLSNGSSTAVGKEALKLSTSDNNTAVGATALQNMTTGGNNTALGAQAGQAVGLGSVNVFVGSSAGVGVTSGSNITAVGYKAGVTGTGANQVTTASQGTYIGCFAGPSSTTQGLGQVAIGYQSLVDGANSTAIGTGAQAKAAGSVAIGHDNSSGAATTTTANAFVLGTSLHLIQMSNNTTGAGSAALGANCPATTATAPYTWIKMLAGDGSTVYVPAWK